MTSRRMPAVASAIALFLVWSLATWWLEGRIETLLRPEAELDRLLYAVIVNIAMGTVGGMLWIRRAAGTRPRVAPAGFGGWRRTAFAVAAALILGALFVVLQGATSWPPMTMLNGFAQVLVVSVAEIVVCWAVVGAAVEAWAQLWGHLVAGLVAAVVASSLFGLYHFAHSPPFDAVAMVGLLTVVGLATSAFFFLSRVVYGTIVFHNILGTYGVLRALDASGRIGQLSHGQGRLVVTAFVSLGVLVACDQLLLRRRLG